MKRTLVAVSALALFATAAIAGDTHQKVVPFGDLNLSTEDGVSTLRTRLLDAAAKVCTEATVRGAKDANFEACKKKAVKDAVADVTTKLAFRLEAIQ